MVQIESGGIMAMDSRAAEVHHQLQNFRQNIERMLDAGDQYAEYKIKATTLEACFVIYAIWSWVSRPPAWWLHALLWIMMFCNEEVTGACACQTSKHAD